MIRQTKGSDDSSTESKANQPEVPVKLLMVDDSEDHIFLLNWNLKKQGLNYESLHVETLEAVKAALHESHWDVVLTDHHLIGFSSKEVIELVRETSPDLPVIILSGEIQEEEAVESMHRGAQDFVMKDNLSRLIPVILREHEQHQIKRDRTAIEEQYRHLRYHDNLTQLVNRQEFESQVKTALDSARYNQQTHWLFFSDLDQFKLVNEACGHTAGDELLVRTTQILKSCIRDRDILARLGGDEFGVLLKNCDEDIAWRVAHAIHDKVKNSRFVWQGREFEISIRIGMVEINHQAEGHDELLNCADTACHAAKSRSWEGIVKFSPRDEEYNQLRSTMQWAPRIRQAVSDDRFELYLQPMANLGAIAGEHAEFLLRLNEGGKIMAPGEFIPAAERYNLMPLVDRWVIRHVFAYLRDHPCAEPSGDLYFVNLSGLSLSDAAFFNDIKQMQHEYGIQAERVCFEITETSAIDNLVDAVEFITETRERGFKFALDDFGVGLSSFSYLKTIPVDYLKIDGSFVVNMLQDSIDSGIVQACNSIAHAAGLKTIAEFVENDAILQALAKMGVDFGQGYGIARPAPLSSNLSSNSSSRPSSNSSSEPDA